MTQNGKTLSMHNEAIWKGTYTDNGTLLKIHENAYTIGYSALLSPDGASAGTVKFGDGVFYNAKEKNNKVYAGKPTSAEAVSAFAGLVAREPAIASGYPAINDEVNAFQKGLLIKEGFVVYKKAFVADGAETELLYANENVMIGTVVKVRETDGAVVFAQTSDTGYKTVGKVIEVNPDDKSVTVYVSPAFYAN